MSSIPVVIQVLHLFIVTFPFCRIVQWMYVDVSCLYMNLHERDNDGELPSVPHSTLFTDDPYHCFSVVGKTLALYMYMYVCNNGK